MGEFPGSSVVRTLQFQGQEPGFSSWALDEDLVVWPKKKRKPTPDKLFNIISH